MGANAELESEFGVETVVDMINSFGSDAGDTGFSDLFRKSTISPEDGGESVRWDEVQHDRDLAPFTTDEGPSVPVKATTRVPRRANLAVIKLHADIPAKKIYRQRAPGRLVRNADEVLAEEVQNLKLRIVKSINWLAVNMLLGTVDINPTNVPGTSLTFPTISVGVNTHSKSTSWATTSTKILSVEMDLLVQKYLKYAGFAPGFIAINGATEGYLTGNLEIQAWAQTQFGMKALGSSPASPEVFGGLPVGGFNWMKDPHGYVSVSSDGTYDPSTNWHGYLATGTGIVLPPPAKIGQILAMCENRCLIPAEAIGSLGSPSANVVEAPNVGITGWIETVSSPLGVRLYLQWEGLPIVKFPKGVMNATLL